jgi:SH3-like domain-containing protein
VRSTLRRISLFSPTLVIGASLLLGGCGGSRSKVLETNYVSASQVPLRDQVSAVYNKIGIVKNGERVDVLDRQRRFIKVRTSSGMEGWMEQRYLINQKTYDQLQQLAQEHRADPVQASGTTRNDINIHLEPTRDAEHLYQLSTGEKVSIIKRATSEKEAAPSIPPTGQSKKVGVKPAMEDWWLVRDAQGRTGWVLARMVDIDVPLDIAQYAEGQRIQAFFPLDSVQDGDKKVSEYLVLLSEPKDGMPFDFNQVRVFTWNVKKHRYETAYRERNLDGVFPVSLGQESFEKEGTLPTFTVRVQNAQGDVLQRKYKLNTPIVRRVLAAGEKDEKAGPAKRRG